MQCQNCNTQNNDDAQYCAACGHQMVQENQMPFTDYAGFWLRFVAVFIDQIILAVVGMIGGAIIGGVMGGAMAASGKDLGAIGVAAGIVGYGFGIVLNWLYYTLLESGSAQATLGKRVMGLKVTDMNGNRISFGQANGRYWSKIISAIILLIGYIMAAFTEKKQALHDIIASTLVVKK